MKKLLFGMMLVSGLSQAAILGGTNNGITIFDLAIDCDYELSSDAGILTEIGCVTTEIASLSTSMPTAVIDDNRVFSEDVINRAIMETSGVVPGQTAINQIANHTGLPSSQVIEAILILGETGEVNIENIQTFQSPDL